MNIFETYYQEIKNINIELSTEHSKRSALEQLIHSIINHNDKLSDLKIIHEPKRKQGFGAPDYLIYTNCSIIGYIENKKITENIENKINSEQIKKYKLLSDNILLTNYIEFIWLKGDEIFSEKLCDIADLGNPIFKPPLEKTHKIERLILNFLSCKPQRISNPQEIGRASCRERV